VLRPWWAVPGEAAARITLDHFLTRRLGRGLHSSTFQLNLSR